MPSICAPSETRNRQRSWMCGSHAAWPTHGLALGERRRHDRVLGSHDRGLVQVDPLAAKTVRLHLVRAVQLDLDAELLKGVDVRIEPATADHVASGRRHRHAPETREKRPGEQERRTDLPAEIGVEIGLVDPARIDPDLVRPGPARRLRRHRPRSSTIVPTSRIRGTFERRTSSEASRLAARIGSAAFLLPAARTVPLSARPPSITKDCMAREWYSAVPRPLSGQEARCSMASRGTSSPGSKPRIWA